MNNTNKAFVGLLASMYFANGSHALELLDPPSNVPGNLADEVTLRWKLVNG